MSVRSSCIRPRQRIPAAALIWVFSILIAVTACERRDSATPGSADPGATAEPLDYTGVYRVSGMTVEVESGASREITGLVVLRQDGDHFATNFDLTTGFEGSGEQPGVSVEVVGRGTGVVGEDDTLRGTAETQLVQAAIPGVDARFALMPRVAGPRIVSTTLAHIRSDGSLVVEIESKPAEGERYAATRTTVVGQRVGEIGSPRPLPSVGAGPASDE